jgi:hypothetical protein
MNPFTEPPLRVATKGANVLVDVAPCLICHNPLGPKPLRLNVVQARKLAHALLAAVRKVCKTP